MVVSVDGKMMADEGVEDVVEALVVGGCTPMLPMSASAMGSSSTSGSLASSSVGKSKPKRTEVTIGSLGRVSSSGIRGVLVVDSVDTASMITGVTVVVVVAVGTGGIGAGTGVVVVVVVVVGGVTVMPRYILLRLAWLTTTCL